MARATILMRAFRNTRSDFHMEKTALVTSLFYPQRKKFFKKHYI